MAKLVSPTRDVIGHVPSHATGKRFCFGVLGAPHTHHTQAHAHTHTHTRTHTHTHMQVSRCASAFARACVRAAALG